MAAHICHSTAFWFRFVFGYSEMIELKRTDALRDIVHRDFSVFAGYALERYFLWKFTEEADYRRIRGMLGTHNHQTELA